MLIILNSDYGNNVSHKKSDNDYYGDDDNAVNFLGIFISTTCSTIIMPKCVT